MPVDLILLATSEILANIKDVETFRFYSIANSICRKEDGSKYSTIEIDRAIMNYYSNLVKNQEIDSITEKTI